MMQNLEMVAPNLQKRLALAVRSIQWSYAIFWSISASQPGVLGWGDGYYNGDIKTRKTVQSIDVNVDKMDLQRSEQLRELFESLSVGEASPHARRPSAALSPEDLTDTEWYYLVCMSFVFDIGQGLPGRTFASNLPIWLSNAHYADTKVFTRSLLAKSASIQTVVCFPFLGGVVELGSVDLILEDLDIIHPIKTSYLEFPCPVVLHTSNPVAGNMINNNVRACDAMEQEILDTKMVTVGCEELGMVSLVNSSNMFQTEQLADDPFFVERMNASTLEVQSWQFMDDEFSNCFHDSMNSSDCISQTLLNLETVEEVKVQCMQDLQECNDVKLSSVELQTDEVHYQSVLSTLIKSSNQLLLGNHFQNCNRESSFISWKKEASVYFPNPRDGNPQRILKKILFEIPQMHVGGSFESPEDIERLSKKYSALESIIPSVIKLDKESILDNTIVYLKELETRVQELESSMDLTESRAKSKRRPQDTVGITSDNENDETSDRKKLLINKRKSCDLREPELPVNNFITKDGSSDNLTVSMNGKEVLIEIKCRWKEGLLLEIMDAVSGLHLDSHCVQSVTSNGILSLTIKAQFKGLTVSSIGMIKREIQKITQKC